MSKDTIIFRRYPPLPSNIDHHKIQDAKELLYDLIHTAVDSATKDFTAGEDAMLRQQLQEQFRFWRRV